MNVEAITQRFDAAGISVKEGSKEIKTVKPFTIYKEKYILIDHQRRRNEGVRFNAC